MILYQQFDLYQLNQMSDYPLTSRLSPKTKYLSLGITFVLGLAFGKSLTLNVPVIYSVCFRFSL